ncbi:MAG: MFS transporter [Verrucomicrobiota bacterium]
MQSIYSMPGVIRLLVAQTQVAFNDNAAKLALMGLAPLVLSAAEAERAVSFIAVLLVAPYVIFAPTVGWLNDRLAKKRVVLLSLGLQVAVMLGILAMLIFQRFEGVLAAFFFLGLQSCLMSPAKRGLASELVGNRRIGEIMGILEMLVVGAILMGSLLGGYFLKELMSHTGNAWQAATWTVAILSGACLFSWILFFGVPEKAPVSHERFRLGLLFGHFRQLENLWKEPVLFRAALGDSTFFFIGGVLVLILAQCGRVLHPGEAEAIWVTALMSASIGVGVIAGAFSASRICRKAIQTGLIPMGAMGMAIALAGLSILPLDSIWIYVFLMIVGFSGGWFLVPMTALLVSRSPERRRGEILAGANLLSSSAGVLAVGFYTVLAQVLGLSIGVQFAVLALVVLVVGVYLIQLLPDELIRLFGLGVAALHYRVKTEGAEHFPKEGGVLLVSNHVSYLDALILSIACPRHPRFLSLESLFDKPVVGWVLKVFGAIPISPRHAKDAIQKASAAVESGEVVCIFPEGCLTVTGELMEVRSGFELIARRAQCPVVVAHMDGLWGSLFSYERGKFFWKWPRAFRLHLRVRFSEPLSTQEASSGHVRELLAEYSRGGKDEKFIETYGHLTKREVVV